MSSDSSSSTLIKSLISLILVLLLLLSLLSYDRFFSTPATVTIVETQSPLSSESILLSSTKRIVINQQNPNNDDHSSFPMKKNKMMTLQSAFACKPNNCFKFKNGNPIRIAFVGDSIIYGNGSHIGDVAGGKIHQIGVWANEAIATLRKRADRCEGSPFIIRKQKRQSLNSRNEKRQQENYYSEDQEEETAETPSFHFDARNFGIGSVSITCEFNRISKTLPFRRAVAFKPHVLVIGVGINDCVPYCKEFSKDKFVRMYKQMILQNFSSAKLVVMVAPPPMEVTGFTVAYGFRPQVVEEVILPLTRKVTADLKDLKKTVSLLDVFSEWSVEFKGGTALKNNFSAQTLIEKEYLIGDGIHPSLKGHQDIARRFDKMICGGGV